MSRIPKAVKTDARSIPKASALHITNDGIVFSFEALEKTEYFNLDGTCQNWASDMLEMCKNISKLTVKQLTSGTYRIYRFHSHEGANCPSPLPEGVELKDIYQMRKLQKAQQETKEWQELAQEYVNYQDSSINESS